MFLSRKYRVGQNYNTNISNKLSECMVKFKYVGGILTNQKSICEEIKSRMDSWNAYYYTTHSLFSSILLYENDKINLLAPELFF